MPESVFTQTMPALFAGGACCAVGVFEVGALAGAAGAGVAAGFVGGAVEAAGVAAGVAVFDFAGVAAGAAAAGAVDVVAGAPADVADFFERDFFGVAELSVVALLSAASVFFGVVFFFVDAVPESGAACELEAPVSAFFFFVLLATLLELV
jgi:hypothetical protein